MANSFTVDTQLGSQIKKPGGKKERNRNLQIHPELISILLISRDQ